MFFSESLTSEFRPVDLFIRDILLYFLVLSLLVLQAIRQYIIEVTPPPLGVWCFPILYTIVVLVWH